MALNKTEKRLRIKKRSKGKIFGTSEILRLSVYKSNKEIYAQLINDDESKTILTVSSRSKDFHKEGSKSNISSLVGKILAEKAITQGVQKVVFDRNGFLYHGRVKSLAEGAREGGLQF
jgi:large subunit ribosomal protein L18